MCKDTNKYTRFGLQVQVHKTLSPTQFTSWTLFIYYRYGIPHHSHINPSLGSCHLQYKGNFLRWLLWWWWLLLHRRKRWGYVNLLNYESIGNFWSVHLVEICHLWSTTSNTNFETLACTSWGRKECYLSITAEIGHFFSFDLIFRLLSTHSNENGSKKYLLIRYTELTFNWIICIMVPSPLT